MQLEAIDRLWGYDSTLLIAPLGFGKAIIGLTAVSELVRDGVVTRVLVLAPQKVATLTWAAEPAKWSHLDVEVAIACGDARERAAAVETLAPIVVTNFDNVKWMIEQYGDWFDGVLIDEITKLKNPGGAWVKTLRKWTKGLKWRAGMSGTVVAECGQDIYSQALLLDGGAALGTRKDQFLRKYFYPLDYNGYKWAVQPDGVARMTRALQDLVYMADDAGYKAALPEVTTELMYVPLSAEGREIDAALLSDGVWGEVECPNAAVVAGKRQQLGAGGLYNSDRVDGGRLVWSDSGKRDALFKLVGSLDEPVIITYNYDFERDYLFDMFPLAPNIGSGSSDDRVFDGVTARLFNAGEIPVLLMHWRSGSHGLNLQGTCRTMIHTSPLWSADGWAQTIGRIRRRGQTSDCKRYVLIAEGSIESEMYSRVGLKGVSEDAFMQALRGQTQAAAAA